MPVDYTVVLSRHATMQANPMRNSAKYLILFRRDILHKEEEGFICREIQHRHERKEEYTKKSNLAVPGTYQ